MQARREFLTAAGGIGAVMISGCTGGSGGDGGDGSAPETTESDESPSGGTTELTFIGTTQQGFFTALGSSLAQVVREQTGGEISITVQTGSGAEANPRTIVNSDPQLSATTSTKAVQAGQGIDPYESPLDLTQFLTPVVTLTPFALTLTGTGIDYLGDLSGKDFAIGPAGSSWNKQYNSYFEANNMDPPSLHHMDYSEGARAVARGRMDAAVAYAPGGFPVGWSSKWITQNDDAKLVVPESEDKLQTWFDSYPGVVEQTLNLERFNAAWENSAVSGQSEMPMGGQAVVLISDTTVPEDVMYRIVKIAIENREALAEALSAWGGFAAVPEQMLTLIVNEAIPYHPGTAKAMEEQGYWSDDYPVYTG